jgi:hypothetical protein
VVQTPTSLQPSFQSRWVAVRQTPFKFSGILSQCGFFNAIEKDILMATKTRNETTSKKVATQASKILRDPKSTPAQKAVAGSALTQRPNKKK